MQPVAAVCLIFAVVISAALWIYLIRVCFTVSTLLGIVAVLLPPIALLSLLPSWQQNRELFLMTLAVLGFISIALIAN